MEGRAGLVTGANHFFYFAYGSNMLRQRIQLKNSSATVCYIAKLPDFELVFGDHKGKSNTRWYGGVASITQSVGKEVWGVVWKINIEDLESLDGQESVDKGVYSPTEVTVYTEAGQELICRTYQMNDCIRSLTSPQYKKVICLGAEQNGLPDAYLEKLYATETNGYIGPVSLMDEIENKLKEIGKNSNI
ncbi:gamma-glutamylcyclotransferase [Protopterus annectens]|uniref:gamma-glutamylcyclotransferase n=1 Tax=Protopterus annectens TaxID=7888 RepID=UPI001CFA9485|nr:gamma-glutamylcyclotransferase [Protopterus annectens]